ncbi:MAG: glycosyltransferase family 39 protein, partial [Bacteroidia bacterium]|nr:glycosyltransferase family 39 protein [Bacteroidia bacterium]
MFVLIIFYLSKMGELPDSPTKITASAGAGAMQIMFKVLSFHAALALILTAAYNSGMLLVNRLPLSISVYSKPLIAIAVGFTFMAFGLFIIGALGFLNQPVCFALIIAMIAIGYKNIIQLFKKIIINKPRQFEIHGLTIFPLLVIVLFVSIALISVIRAIPIGFDALTLYMNTPKLIAGYGALTEGGQAYNWSLIMSLGFVLFKNTTLTVSLSVLPGILCILALYRIAVNFVNRDWAIFTCAAFYTFPNIVFQSRYDAKVDLAMLFIILCCVLLVVEHYFRKIKHPPKIQLKPIIKNPDVALWALCGLLFGFAFGIKYTALFSIFGFLILNFYIVEGKWSAIGVFFLNFSVIFGLGLTKFSNVEVSPDKMGMLVAVPAIIGLAFLGWAIKENKKGFFEGVKRVVVFGSIIAITFVPWAVKHISEQGKFSIDALITGKAPLPPFQFGKPNASIENNAKQPLANKQEKESIPVMYAGFGLDKDDYSKKKLLAQNETVEKKKPKKKINTAKYEEVNRYIG